MNVPASALGIPVVPHKAVAEVSKIGEFTDGPKGGWSFFFSSGCNGCSGRLPQLLDEARRSAVVVVVGWTCSCSIV